MSRWPASSTWTVAGLMAGVAAGLVPCIWRPVPAGVALVALAVAWRRAPGRWVACFGLGLVTAWSRPPVVPLPAGWPDTDRPVTADLRALGEWRPAPYGWRLEARAQLLRQGPRVARWGERVHLTVGGAARPPAGERLRVTGYLGRSSGFANGGAPRPGPWRLRTNSRRFVVAERGRTTAAACARALVRTLAAPMRDRVERAVGARESGGGAALVRALILGRRQVLGAERERALRRAGLAHLLAVSGLHVSLVAGLAHRALGRLPSAWRLAAAAAAVGAYLLLVGPRPSIVRASLMALIAGAGLLLERPGGAARSLAVACCAMVVARPGLVTDLAFQLSASATAGVLWGGAVLAPAWKRLPRPLARAAAATLGAQVASLPWALPAFHLLTPAATLWNLLAAPWIVLTLSASLLLAATAQLDPRLASPLVPLLDRLAAPVDWLAELPPGPLSARPVVVARATAFAASVAVAAALRWPRRGVPALGAALLVARALAPSDGAPPELVLFDVGQGESLLLWDGDATLLVDGGGWRGGDVGGRVLVPALARLGVRRLRAVALSHPDADHCLGLVDIAAYLPVEEVWISPGWAGSACAARLETLPGTRLRSLWRGESARLGRWRIEALHPAAGQRGGRNDRSLALVAETRGRRFLLTGDLEAPGERRLAVALAPTGEIDVLKLAHHGSRTSTTERLLDHARPRLALVSAGRGNLYGHPSPVVLERLRGRGVPVLRTDLHGRIRIAVLRDGTLDLSISPPG